jgi:zinc transporter
MTPNTKSAVPGLIAAWRLRPGEAPEPLHGLEAVSALVSGESGLWLHTDLADPRARELFVRLPIPPAARRVLLEPDETPHLEAADGAIYGGVADFQQAGAGVSLPETGLLHAVLTADILVTAQLVPLRTVHAVSRDPSGGAPAEVFARLLHGVADAMGEAAHFLSAQLSRVEDSLLKSGSSHADRQSLSALRRAALRLERVFAPTAETLAQWAEEPVGPLAEPFCAPVLREARWEGTVRRGLASLQERARITQDELAGLATEETNRRLFVLSVLSAAILPATLITGVFGMNVGAVPGVDKEWGFLMAMGLIVGSIIVILAALRFWKLL